MYLIHNPLMYWFMAFFTHPMEFAPPLFTIFYLGLIIATIVASALLYLLVRAYYLDLPFHIIPCITPLAF